MAEEYRFAVKFSHRGKFATAVGIPREITAPALLAAARTSLGMMVGDDDDGVFLRLIYKGRTIAREQTRDDDDNDDDDGVATRPAFPTAGATMPKNGGIANVMVVGGATTASDVREINSSQSDPLMRGFDGEASRRLAMTSSIASQVSQPTTPPPASPRRRRWETSPDVTMSWKSAGSNPSSASIRSASSLLLLELLSTINLFPDSFNLRTARSTPSYGARPSCITPHMSRRKVS